jgi:hypothetical protein
MSRLAFVLVVVAAVVVYLSGGVLEDIGGSDVAGDYDPTIELDEFAPDGFNASARTGMNDDVDDGSDGFTGL